MPYHISTSVKRKGRRDARGGHDSGSLANPNYGAERIGDVCELGKRGGDVQFRRCSQGQFNGELM